MFHKLPPLNAIRAFESAARLNSFKGAAHELNVTPTAISHQIRVLEDKLKIRLFERKTRSVALTKEGKLLAATAYTSLNDLLNSINQLTSAPNALTISTTNSFAAMWLVPNLADFQQQNPTIDIMIRAEDSLIDIEHDRRVDMAIRYGQPAHQPGCVPLIEESLGFFATPECWQKFNGQPENTMFFCTKWKNPDLPSLGIEETLTNITSKQNPPSIRYFTDESQTIQAALSGQGIGIISQLAVETSITNGWLEQGRNGLSNTFTGLHYYLVIPTRQQANQTALQFKRWLLEKLANR